MVQNFRFKQSDLGVFNTSEAKDVSRLINHGCRILGLTRGKFSMIDLIYSILTKVGKSHVCCVTWSAGIKDVHNVKWMQNSNLIESFTLITDHSYRNRQRKYALAIEDLFGKENIRTSEIHAKFTLIWNDDYKICIRTSMNLNANKTCESFEIDEGEEIFDFYKNFVNHTFGDLPEGFTDSSYRVNQSLDRYFNEQNTTMKGWSEI